MEEFFKESFMGQKPESKRPEDKVAGQHQEKRPKVIIEGTEIDPEEYDAKIKEVFGHPNSKLDRKKQN